MRLLVTGAYKCTEAELSSLRALGCEVIPMPDERGELPVAHDTVEGVVCNGLFLYHPIESFTSLRYIQLTSAGYDRVPMDYVSKHGIEIHNARGVYDVPMAEYAVWAVLSAFKGGALFHKNQAAHKWEKNRTVRELATATVLIVGCGSVGTECARRFGALGARVIGVDICTRESEQFEKIYPTAELGLAASLADAVILTLPYTEGTAHIINSHTLSAFKQGAVLVNIARGGVLDTAALTDALREGVLSCAVLDVFEEEPLAENSTLWDTPGIVITPHNSFVGNGNQKRLTSLIYENLEKRKTK